jgi:cytochrome c oxidase subunit III
MKGDNVSVVVGAAERPDSGIGSESQRLGLILFIASEAILFGGIFANYFYNRVFSNGWPPAGGSVHERVPAAPLAVVLTIVLLLSGWTCHRAVEAVRRNSQMGMLGWLSATIALGAAFLVGQAFEYSDLMGHGMTLNSGLYASTFYGLTGLHGAHVLAGVGVLIVMYLRGLAGHFNARRHFGLEAATIYWHFVDLVWVALYLAVYLL